MGKIIVTEKEAKEINDVLWQDATDLYKFSAIVGRCKRLNFIQVARIIEGEVFEVKREFKVGDIVRRSNGTYLEITDGFNPSTNYICSNTINDDTYFTYKLICKAEDRQDLKNG